MLEIINLHAEVEGQKILQGLDLKIDKGEVHSIMGPNGSGKSTLASILAGKEDYDITDGDIVYKGESILELSPDERAQEGIFLAFQYPIEIPGVSNGYFLREAYNCINEARGNKPLKPVQFGKLAKEKIKMLKMDDSFLQRSLNEGFSGGEKKRNEILQMITLKPSLSILDETDSGLDIDALQTVSKGINEYRTNNRSFIVITHYQRMLDYLNPDYVHVLMDGKIVKTGNQELAKKLEKNGYSWIEEELKSLV